MGWAYFLSFKIKIGIGIICIIKELACSTQKNKNVPFYDKNLIIRHIFVTFGML